MSRGLNNNNAGNIIQSQVVYAGEKLPSTDPKFKQFISAAYGYRAIFVLLRYYIGKDFNTVRKIFTRYEPVNYEAYINFIVKFTGIPENRVIDRDDWQSLGKIVAGISKMENGVPAVMKDLTDGMKLAQSGQSAPSEPKQGKKWLFIPIAALTIWRLTKL